MLSIVPPSIISSTGKIEKVEKDEAEFKCQATGKPAPTYRFYKVSSLLQFY